MKWTLQSLSATTGYLQSCPIAFVQGLNCIIGARGTCKSTVVETIRFVFDCEPEKVEVMIKPATSATVANGQPSRSGLLLNAKADRQVYGGLPEFSIQVRARRLRSSTTPPNSRFETWGRLRPSKCCRPSHRFKSIEAFVPRSKPKSTCFDRKCEA